MTENFFLIIKNQRDTNDYVAIAPESSPHICRNANEKSYSTLKHKNFGKIRSRKLQNMEDSRNETDREYIQQKQSRASHPRLEFCGKGCQKRAGHHIKS
jgi:hypothetical protein